MSQYQPPQGAPGQPFGAPAQGQPGTQGQTGPQGQPGGFGQQPGPFGQPQGQGPQPGQPFGGPQHGGQNFGTPGSYGATKPGGGLFDTSFHTLATPNTAKIAYIAIIILAAVLTLGGLFDAIGYFAGAAALSQYGIANAGGAGSVLNGIVALLKGPALGFVVLVVGRLFVELCVRVHRQAEAAKRD